MPENPAGIYFDFKSLIDGMLESLNCALDTDPPIQQCLAPRLSRSMATETSLSSESQREYDSSFLHTASDPVSELHGKPVSAVLSMTI